MEAAMGRDGSVGNSCETLASDVLRQARRDGLRDLHVTALTAFVEQIRAARGLSADVPFVDPADGGVSGQALFVLEAPGPKAVFSGFVSRDNPDFTASNLGKFLNEAGISRAHSIVWNIVPWYIGSGSKILPASKQDVREGLVHLRTLIAILPHLKAIVLLGRKAQSAYSGIGASPSVRVFHSPHPSPRYVNLDPDNRGKIVSVFQHVAAHLRDSNGCGG
jgi:uracil-DNA glycosylase